MITQSELIDDLKIEELLNSSGTVKPTEKKIRYDLEFNKDTHWRLVRLGALKKMHQEDFVEKLITSVIEVLAMDEEEGENLIDNVTDEELQDLWNNTIGFKPGLRAIYDLGREHRAKS